MLLIFSDAGGKSFKNVHIDFRTVSIIIIITEELGEKKCIDTKKCSAVAASEGKIVHSNIKANAVILVACSNCIAVK